MAATDAPAGKKKDAPAATATPAAPTQYVILEAVRLRYNALEGIEGVSLPGGLHADGQGYVTLWLPLRNEKAEQGPDGGVRIVETSGGKEAAIKLATVLADVDGGSAQRAGSFKGVPLRSWQGGKRYKNRETVVTDSEDLED